MGLVLHSPGFSRLGQPSIGLAKGLPGISVRYGPDYEPLAAASHYSIGRPLIPCKHLSRK